MNEKGKADIINTTFLILGILSIFFAGHFLENLNLMYLSLFLFVCGVLILSVRISFVEEGDKTE